MADGIERFRAAAGELGVPVALVQYPASTRTAADAAAAVGCDLGQIVKSLVFASPSRLVLALTSGTNQVDTDRLGALVGGRISLADPETVRSATGFAIGGTPPFGHVNPLPTWIDEDLLAYDTVWAAAGTPNSCFPIAPTLLATTARAVTAGFARR
ncbi:YbaK/EbsC family protein [Candidatus Poriferisocius sp.]|uniref:YbaK/EbsC family protein n=1 Tax=Candidatus Poriferisocius sp. TaxID=3101276 RepID=UPI003B024E7C